METSIEYISAGIVLCLILGVTARFSTDMVNDRVNRIQQTADLKIADKMVDSLLLSQGTPSNWGQSVDPPTSIGLALGSAIQPYQLDGSKVRCLSNASDNYIPPSNVRDLLGLSQNYYLSIEIYPIYSISIQNIANQKFLITVTNQWNVPVSTVNVTGGYTDIINVNSTEITSFVHGGLKNTIVKYNTTNTLGQCILNYSGMGSKKTLIIMASQLDVKSLSIKSLVTPPVTSPDLITSIDSSMGSSSDYNVEIVYRSVIIDEMNYFCKLTLWWS